MTKKAATRMEERPVLDLPQNIEAEQAALGSIMLQPETLWQLLDLGLQETHFYIVKHGWIFSAMMALERQSKQIDFMSLCDQLEQRGQLEEIGGPAYVSKLINSVPTALHGPTYARIVLGTAKRRSMLNLAGRMAESATNEDEELDQSLREIETELSDLSQIGAPRPIVPFSQAISDLWDQLQPDKSDDRQTAIQTQFMDLDKILGGFYPGDFYLVAARPSVGKTAFLCQLALNAAKQGKRVLFFSVEMRTSQIAARIIASHSGIDSFSIRRDSIGPAYWDSFAQAIPGLTGLPIFFDDTPYITPFSVRARVRQQMIRQGVDLILIDYLQLMSAGVKTESRNREIGYISQGLKMLARTLDLPVIAASQLSRGVEHRADKRPMLSDLRDSGELEQDADAVLFLHRPEMYEPETDMKNICDVILAKNRHGPTGTVQLFFQRNCNRFRNAEVYHVNLGDVRL